MSKTSVMSAHDARARLVEGNRRYVESGIFSGDVGQQARERTYEHGQHPFAIVVTCSDSRVIPEAIFSCGIGELFVVRVAGNVIDDHQLGSIEYAAQHLGCQLVVVLGHTKCGAVDAVIHHEPEGYIRYITDEIARAIGDEQDAYKATCLNALHSCRLIEESLVVGAEETSGLAVAAAVYRCDSGYVEFLDA